MLNEEAIRLNFVLIYELLDEVLVSLSIYYYTLFLVPHTINFIFLPYHFSFLFPPSPQDFGYPQGTSTEVLKSYICHTPCPVTYEARSSLSRVSSSNTLPSHAANKPIATSLESMRNQKNEIFIDLLERLTVLVASNVSVWVCKCVGLWVV